MDFNEALKRAVENGKGTVIRDSAGRAWRVTDTGIEVVKPIRHNGCDDGDCWTVGADWHVEPIPKPQPQPQPEPELMTGVQAMVAAVNQGGGEIWYASTDGEDEYRATLNVGAQITGGKISGLSPVSKVYYVRPLPPETLDFTEAMARLMRGEKVRDRYGNTLWPEIIATNDNRTLFKIDLTRYSTDDRFTAVEA